LVQESLYERVAQVLTREILNLEYAVKRIENKDDWPNFEERKNAAERHLGTAAALLRGIRSAFAGNGANENWAKLFAYVAYVSSLDETVRDTSTSVPDEGTLAREGYKLANRLFKSEEVVKDVEDLLDYTSTPPQWYRTCLTAVLCMRGTGPSHGFLWRCMHIR